MEPKRISSALTPFVKLVLPLAWMGGFGAGTVIDWLTASPDRFGSLSLLLVGSVFLLAMCADLSRVRISGDKLLVSNYLMEIEVPAADIVEVSENRWNSIHPVTIRLDRDTRFGRKIRFMPKMRWFRRGPHPVVEELSRLAKAKKGAAARS